MKDGTVKMVLAFMLGTAFGLAIAVILYWNWTVEVRFSP